MSVGTASCLSSNAMKSGHVPYAKASQRPAASATDPVCSAGNVFGALPHSTAMDIGITLVSTRLAASCCC